MKFLNTLVSYHKSLVDTTAAFFGLSSYQLNWISFFKGIVVGILLTILF